MMRIRLHDLFGRSKDFDLEWAPNYVRYDGNLFALQPGKGPVEIYQMIAAYAVDDSMAAAADETAPVASEAAA